jgi:hypothetical protein
MSDRREWHIVPVNSPPPNQEGVCGVPAARSWVPPASVPPVDDGQAGDEQAFPVPLFLVEVGRFRVGEATNPAACIAVQTGQHRATADGLEGGYITEK